MNKTSLLPAPIAALKPRPTAAAVRSATALALHEEQVLAHRQLDAALKVARDNYKAAAVKYLRKHARTLEFEDSITPWGSADITLSVNLDPIHHPELSAARDAFAAAKTAKDKHKVQDVKDIERHLRAAAEGQLANPVAALLADPQIKAALLAAGKKALTTPTPNDKAAAIEA